MAEQTDAPETVEWDRRLDLSLRLRAACIAFDELLRGDSGDGILFSEDAELVELRRAAGLACGLDDEQGDRYVPDYEAQARHYFKRLAQALTVIEVCAVPLEALHATEMDGIALCPGVKDGIREAVAVLRAFIAQPEEPATEG